MHRRGGNPRGFTMLEIVVGIFLLTIGALGYALVTVNLARSFLVDSRRARSGELLDSQRETLLQQTCSRASSGAATRFGMPVTWSVGAQNAPDRTLLVVVTRQGPTGSRSDSLQAVIPC